MNLEITPEPTDAERAAIAAALATDTEIQPESWDDGDAGDCQEIFKP
ncbi:MAG TPA: hypothetical protein VF091_08490 [Gaiellaceae bacterium]